MAQDERVIRALGLCRPPTGKEPQERATVAWSFALFFCVFASWYILRPLRDAMGIAGSTRELPRLFLVTLGATLALTPVVSTLVSRLSRPRFLTFAYRFLAASLLLFFLLLRGPATSPLAARAFFVWASVFNLFAITLAWALMADIFTRAQGIRVFALVGGGGTLGAMVGSLAATLVVPFAGASAMLLLAAALLECAVRCVRCVTSLAPPRVLVEQPYPQGGTLRWIGRAARDPFFLAICAYLAFFTFTSTVLYLEQGRIVRTSLADTSARAELFARMDLSVNTMTLVLQLFFVGRAIRFIGVGLALAAFPVLTFVCFVALRLEPVLGVLVACQVARRALDYALVKPAREVLFTVVRPEDKYKAKSFIDTFVYRSGDALGAVSFEDMWGPAVVVGMGVVCAAWALVGLALGRARSR
jgi:AAA family ATP:ADP antiporter